MPNKCSAVAEIGDRLATTDGPKIGGLCPFWCILGTMVSLSSAHVVLDEDPAPI